jgi:3-(3-hydroxy-phenyl)propionate hydroxylase
MTVDADVAIVGFGPGGEVLASLLGQAGHRVVVFEKFPAPYGLPRMSTLDGEIARLLQHTSDAEKALKDSLPQRAGNLYGADGNLAIRFDWEGDLCGHPRSLSLHQPNIESAMQERIDSCPTVDVRWGTEVIGIDDLGDTVRVTARTVSTSGDPVEQQLVASYVVGMDGAASFVRDTLGIPLEVVHQHDDQWFITDFDILDPAIEEPETEIHMVPGAPYYWGPNGARRCRIDVRLTAGQNPADLMDYEHGYAWLEQNIGIPRESVRISRRVPYRFRSQFATSFRRGRVFIGGDAAHAMTPFMAQGSCSAMRDGANLAWKLDLVLTGRSHPRLLDTYEPERLTHVAPLVRGSLAQWGLIVEGDPAKAAGRDAYLRSGEAHVPPMPTLTTGTLQRNTDGEVAIPVGALSPQGKVRIGDREGLLDDLVGFGFQLISSFPLDDVLTEAQRDALALIGAKVLVLGDGDGQMIDLDGTYADFLAEHRIGAFISRPDFYVFGTADSPSDVSALVEDLLQQLSLTTEQVPA